MQFGGKVFIIGWEKNEQLVSVWHLCATAIYVFKHGYYLNQFPFMHLSQTRSNIRFQYRYAIKYVSQQDIVVYEFYDHLLAVPEGYPSSC